MNEHDPSATPALQVRPTRGDFGHAGRRGVRLACCTTTTCCFTLLLGAVGGVAGLATGIVVAAKPGRRSPKSEATLVNALLSIVLFLLYAFGYAVCGLLIGAAVGFGIDALFVFH